MGRLSKSLSPPTTRVASRADARETARASAERVHRRLSPRQRSANLLVRWPVLGVRARGDHGPPREGISASVCRPFLRTGRLDSTIRSRSSRKCTPAIIVEDVVQERRNRLVAGFVVEKRDYRFSVEDVRVTHSSRDGWSRSNFSSSRRSSSASSCTCFLCDRSGFVIASVDTVEFVGGWDRLDDDSPLLFVDEYFTRRLDTELLPEFLWNRRLPLWETRTTSGFRDVIAIAGLYCVSVVLQMCRWCPTPNRRREVFRATPNRRSHGVSSVQSNDNLPGMNTGVSSRTWESQQV